MPTNNRKPVKLPADCMPMCRTCAFGVFEKGSDTGSCHRYPPAPSGDWFAFPDVTPDTWCGEFQRKVI